MLLVKFNILVLIIILCLETGKGNFDPKPLFTNDIIDNFARSSNKFIIKIYDKGTPVMTELYYTV